MAALRSRRSVGVVGVVCLALLAWNLRGRGEEGKSRPAVAEPNSSPKPTPLFYGVQACAGRCHDLKEPIDAEKEKFPPLCRRNEITLWEAKDKHKNAYNVLKEERAAQMGKLLDAGKPDSERK